ncbi:TPA: hypothetical protein ACUW8I_001265 [Yersinia enterocolitica]
MAKCSGCDASLSDSLIAEEEGKVYKSCPSCSEKVGHHVFYRYDDFGMRDMGDGRYIVQSWCPDCRFKEPPVLQVSFECE